ISPAVRESFCAWAASAERATPHNAQCDVRAGEIAMGNPHPRAAEARVIGLLDMESRRKRHAPERRANCLASGPECARWQRYRALRSRAAELDGADDRAVPIDSAGAARAIEAIKREKLAGYEAPRGVGGEAFRARWAGCEQDQNHHCQPCKHTEPSRRYVQRQQLAARKRPIACLSPWSRLDVDIGQRDIAGPGPYRSAPPPPRAAPCEANRRQRQRSAWR